METVAVYREYPVKVYGVKLTPGLVMLRASGPHDRLPAVARALAEPDQPFRPAMVAASWNGGAPRLAVCLEPEQCGQLTAALLRAGFTVDQGQPVCLIHLQGPHFGDRFGIVDLAMTGLHEAKVEPLAVSAVVHSVFIAVRQPDASKAVAGLNNHFCLPGSS